MENEMRTEARLKKEMFLPIIKNILVNKDSLLLKSSLMDIIADYSSRIRKFPISNNKDGVDVMADEWIINYKRFEISIKSYNNDILPDIYINTVHYNINDEQGLTAAKNVLRFIHLSTANFKNRV